MCPNQSCDKSNGQGSQPPTSTQRQLIEKLLRADFPGNTNLRRQLDRLRVRQIDDEGSLKLEVDDDSPAADVLRRIPVEGEITDTDGVIIHVLMHVVEGYMDELEIYREDSAPLQTDIRPEGLSVVVY